MEIKFKGLQFFYDRHFVERCYVRLGKDHRVPIDLKKFPRYTPEFAAEYLRIKTSHEITSQPKPGTLGTLIERYRKSADFKNLSAKTQKDYDRYLTYLDQVGIAKIHQLKPSLIRMIRDQAAEAKGHRTGQYVKQVMSLLFTYAVDRGFMESNPAKGLKPLRRPRDLPEANRPWSLDECINVLDALPAHMRVPISLMMFTGIDPQDALTLPRNAIKDGIMDTRRGKTRVAVLMQVPPMLDRILASSPQHSATTVAANSQGLPWTISGYRASFRKIRIALERDGKVERGLTLKGLRHTVGTMLAELGYHDRNIAGYLGHKNATTTAHYTRRADMSAMNAEMGDKLSSLFDTQKNKERVKSVKPS